jgi:hypothetical protein
MTTAGEATGRRQKIGLVGSAPQEKKRISRPVVID